MKATSHKVKHYYQPTTSSCGYTALSILLSHYEITVTPEMLLDAVEQPKDEAGEPVGSITSQLITHTLQKGPRIKLYTFDCQIIDLSWQGLSKDKIVERLEAVEDVRDVRGVGGKHWSKVYVESYIAMLKAGGELEVLPYPTTKLLYSLLIRGPVYANVCPAVLYASGRSQSKNPHTSIPDDVNGSVHTHSLVIYGNDEAGNFLLADPWDGLTKVEPEALLAGITGAEIECDNMCFQITKA